MPKQKRKYLIIHCTATQEGIEKTSADIEEFHLAPAPLLGGQVQFNGKVYKSRMELPDEKLNGKSIKKLIGRGWRKVGYSKLILLDGIIHSFVQENEDEFVDSFEMTNGAVGVNAVSMHICYVGGIDKNLQPKDTRTELQKFSMKEIVLLTIKRWPDIKVAGHYNFAKKACPSFNVQDWCVSIGVPEKNIYRGKK